MMTEGRFHRAWGWAAAVVLGAVATAAAQEIVLYRIPTRSGKWFEYTDERPPESIHFDAVKGFSRTSRPVLLRTGQRQVLVYYPTGEDESGRRICEDVWYALRLLERIAGFSFAWPGDIKIYKVPEFEIGAAAQHRGRRGVMTSDGDPFLMYHEIAHYWADWDLYSERWQLEGLAELYAYIVGKRVRGERAAELFRAAKFKGIRDYTGQDFPLDTWGRGEETTLERERFAYGKAFAVWSMLLERVGLHRLQQVNRAIRAQGKPVDSREFIGLLDRIAGPGKADEVYSGWILAGPYRLKGKTLTLSQYVDYLEKRPPPVPAQLDPAIAESRPAPAPTSRPTGYFVDEEGRPLEP